MNKKLIHFKSYQSLNLVILFLAISCTVLVCLSFLWNRAEIIHESNETARIHLKTAYEKDVIYRRWNALSRGVYVPVSDSVQPNPYLIDVPERDIFTMEGKQLTLINPAYMTRQVHELQIKDMNIRGHITSLNPIRPENKPDSWERKALESFESGIPEVFELDSINGKEFFRYMEPLITEKSCLHCHAKQGYNKGEIRGGISVSIPATPIKKIIKKSVNRLGYLHFIVWLFGISVIIIGFFVLNRSNKNRIETKKNLAEAYDQIELKVQERTDELISSLKKRRELEFIINKSQVIVFLWRAEKGWPVEYVSENINLFGYSADDFYSGKIAYSDIIHPDDLEQVTNEVITASEKGDIEFKQQYRIHTKSGDIRWTDDITWIRRDEKGNITHYQGIVFDITERKLSEKYIQQLSSILENSLNEIFIFDADSLQFVYANQGALKNIGYSLNELIKFTPVDIKPEVDSKKFNKLLEPLKSGKNHKIVFETVHERKDKSRYNVEIHLQKSIFNEKEVYVAIILDITERKKAEKELEGHRLNLEELVSERTEQLEKLNLDFAEKNENLDRMNNVFVGREIRIKELKDEINLLKEKLSEK